MFNFNEKREKIPKYIKYKEEDSQGKHLVKQKKEKDYEYYVCDYCGDEIKILDKKYEMSGGIVVFPSSLTHKKDLKMILCNKCLNPVTRSFEKKIEKENKYINTNKFIH